ncbi:MAG TPA: hypothetical protein VGC07_02830 [Granulicella sp.]
MSTGTQAVLPAQIEAAAKAAGLVIVNQSAGADSVGKPTTRFAIALAAAPEKALLLELSEGLDLGAADRQAVLKQYLDEEALRLRNPRPDVYLTLHGLPLGFDGFAWPFHQSSSGADTSLVHGEIWLETGEPRLLHAKISASMTVTFREVVAVPEQPFAESFIYNAVRKTIDQGQLELVKSGNRQPVPVTTRYFSTKQKRFIFNDTTEAQRTTYLAAKTYWLSGVLGGGAPVWLLDPRDAQYLNTTPDDLRKSAEALAAQGAIVLAADGFATPSPALLSLKEQYDKEVAEALSFIKPTFNEEMRAGHTNM